MSLSHISLPFVFSISLPSLASFRRTTSHAHLSHFLQLVYSDSSCLPGLLGISLSVVFVSVRCISLLIGCTEAFWRGLRMCSCCLRVAAWLFLLFFILVFRALVGSVWDVLLLFSLLFLGVRLKHTGILLCFWRLLTSSYLVFAYLVLLFIITFSLWNLWHPCIFFHHCLTFLAMHFVSFYHIRQCPE